MDSVPKQVQLILPIIFLGVGALVFCLLGSVYGWQGIEDLHTDSFEFAIGSSWGTNWHRSYAVADHPFLFAVRVLVDATGAVGAFGIGLLLFGTLIWISTEKLNPLFKKADALIKPCVLTAVVTFGAHFVLTLVPYLLAFTDVR